MSAEVDLLKRGVSHQIQVYEHCNAVRLPRWRRLLVQAWLSEVGLLLARLQRDVTQFDDGKPTQTALRMAWARYWQVFTALSPITQAAQTGDGGHVGDGLELVARRLLIVFLFLIAQLAVAVTLIVITTGLFGGFDPQTALTSQQWQARAPARAHIHRVVTMLNDAQRQPAAASAGGATTPVADDTVPDVTVVRGDVESLAVSLPQLGLATNDLRTANVWIDAALEDLDKDPPRYREAAASLDTLDRLLAANAEKAPPTIIPITVLGSLLGMITITIHLNWKFRNRWDTVGFLPWYVTKLIAAPVISLAAVGLLSQVTFTKDVSSSSSVASLGLLGATPLLMFSVAILTGLFSNRIFDWLRDVVGNSTAAATGTKASTTVSTVTATEEDAGETR